MKQTNLNHLFAVHYYWLKRINGDDNRPELFASMTVTLVLFFNLLFVFNIIGMIATNESGLDIKDARWYAIASYIIISTVIHLLFVRNGKYLDCERNLLELVQNSRRKVELGVLLYSLASLLAVVLSFFVWAYTNG